MTQLFSRLLASDFPHPPGPIRDSKVRKGQRLRFVPWEAEPLSFTGGRAPPLCLERAQIGPERIGSAELQTEREPAASAAGERRCGVQAAKFDTRGDVVGSVR